MMSTQRTPPPTDFRHARRQIAGTLAVYVGAAILLIAGLEQTATGLPALPRFWYVNHTLWIGLGFLLIPFGAALQIWKPQGVYRWRATRLGRRFERVLLYSRPGCHLCDEALEVLQKSEYQDYLPDVEVVDIEGDAELVGRFGTIIPVVACDGKIRFKGRVDEGLLRRLIEGTPSLRSGHEPQD